eukprot:4993650-Karenia_brevis.AAC.1
MSPASCEIEGMAAFTIGTPALAAETKMVLMGSDVGLAVELTGFQSARGVQSCGRASGLGLLFKDH